ncbi:hypothetical protein MLD38_035925 [Melastoma candidum]|uniref:Uncharacterized protein n=1 Tax=Melastoma candidum TaxID=119954 RepID=A0ACB9LII3_9MYRT|nr:hypothetical protein MLD38_035925 [Melastoma candidum]
MKGLIRRAHKRGAIPPVEVGLGIEEGELGDTSKLRTQLENMFEVMAKYPVHCVEAYEELCKLFEMPILPPRCVYVRRWLPKNARYNPTMISSVRFILLAFLLLATVVPSKLQGFSEDLDPKRHGPGREKLSHLHFYLHDTVTGRDPTAMRVAEAPLLQLVHKGVYASASQKDVSLLIVFNFFFTEGKYNGRMLSVLGRNAPLEDLRELPILGGSGLFRFAQGYAHARTHYLDIIMGDAIVKYDIYVLHY